MRLLCVVPITALLACDVLDDESVVASELAAEQPFGVAEIVSRYYTDPDIARNSFATGETDQGCTGIMIGPTTMMTSLTCNNVCTGYFTGITFHGYRDGGIATQSTEHYDCRLLGAAPTDCDLALYDCPAPPPPPLVSGPPPLPPGDVFGYIDAAGPHASETSVYSIWYGALAGVDHLFYSRGTRTAWRTAAWWLPDENLSAQGAITDLWPEESAHGAALLSATDDKLYAGPGLLSSGSAGTTVQALLADDEDACLMVGGGSACPAYDPPYLDTLGFGGPFSGPMDGSPMAVPDPHDLFDLPRLVDEARGVAPRWFYWLGFGSQARDWRWHNTASPLTRITEFHGMPRDTLVNRRLALPAGTYRVRVSIDPTFVAAGATLTLALRDGSTVRASGGVPLVASGGFHTYTLSLTTTAPANQLAFVAAGGVIADVRDVSIHQRSSSLLWTGYSTAFEAADERLAWRDANTGGTPLMLPDGRNASAANIDFAGVVPRPAAGVAANNNWPLEYRNAPLIGGATHRVCFDHKQRGGISAPATAWAVVQVRTGTGVTATSVSFTPTGAWATTCTDVFTPTAGDYTIRFGTTWGIGLFYDASYLIDRVTIQST